MEEYSLSANNYFDLTACWFKTIFEHTGYAWEALTVVQGYVEQALKNPPFAGKLYNDTKDIFIGEGTIIQDGAHLEGPILIGKNCTIGHGSYIRAYTLLGDFVRVGHGAEVKHSIFLNGSTAAHLNYIGDSIVGNNVNISAGAVFANFRLDKKKIVIKLGEKLIESGLEKFGAIVGDDSNIGVNSVLNPGTILGKRTVVYPLTNVMGVHKNEEIIK